MPTYNVGASYLFVTSGILRPQQRKDLKDVAYVSFISLTKNIFSINMNKNLKNNNNEKSVCSFSNPLYGCVGQL